MGNCTTLPETSFLRPGVVCERFASLVVLRFELVGLAPLPVRQQQLVFYLSQAALMGRDMAWDQTFKYNIKIRRVLEEIYRGFQGDRDTNEFNQFHLYLKQVWFHNGVYNSESKSKLEVGFDGEYLYHLLQHTPLLAQQAAKLKKKLGQVLFLDKHAFGNFTEDGIMESDVRACFHNQDQGLNSKRIKGQDGVVGERVYSVNGMYDKVLVECCKWLVKAGEVADDPLQRECIQLLIKYYSTGELKYYHEHQSKWTGGCVVDFVHGFINTRNDPLGLTGTFESIVYIRDSALTRIYSLLAQEASWFEAQSPIHDEYKKPHAVGLEYIVGNAVLASGGAFPAIPREIQVGPTLLFLDNISRAYESMLTQSANEYYLAQQQVLMDEFGQAAEQVMAGLRQVVGRNSGQIQGGEGIGSALGKHAQCMELARLDLVALYFVGDDYLINLGVTPSAKVMEAAYVQFMVTGLLLLGGGGVRSEYVQSRQLVARWAVKRGVVEVTSPRSADQEGSFVSIPNYPALRQELGELLREVQRIKSEGDFSAAAQLVQAFGEEREVESVDEMLARHNHRHGLSMGFINPQLGLELSEDSVEVVQVTQTRPSSFTEQMLLYAEHYSPLLDDNN
ncbi:hypothetical protein BASA81_002031 [Batrachochytrium salamandrivorans]|nr:hypothetical protein BASA81_002031 [Batrachochytrium salamandrivorans]